MHSIRSALLQAQIRLNDSPRLDAIDARFEAQLLLRHLLHVNRAWLIAHENDSLSNEAQAGFEQLTNRRADGEPIAYILGSREF